MGVLLALLRELMLQLMDLLSLGLLLRLTGTASAKRTSARMFAGLTNAASAHTVQVELVWVSGGLGAGHHDWLLAADLVQKAGRAWLVQELLCVRQLLVRRPGCRGADGGQRRACLQRA